MKESSYVQNKDPTYAICIKMEEKRCLSIDSTSRVPHKTSRLDHKHHIDPMGFSHLPRFTLDDSRVTRGRV